MKKIFIASDHAGFERKQELMQRMPGLPWVDLGTQSKDSVDYPDYAKKLVQALIPELGSGELLQTCGVLICGSGQGMCITANRSPEIRAALCWTPEIASLSRQHNNANVLCLPARFVSGAEAQAICQAFLDAKFEGGRHSLRLAKIKSALQN